jgi:hypothetical protein
VCINVTPPACRQEGVGAKTACIENRPIGNSAFKGGSHAFPWVNITALAVKTTAITESATHAIRQRYNTIELRNSRCCASSPKSSIARR